jgi:hypothetical protein
MAKLNVTRAAAAVGITRAAMRRAIARGDVHRDAYGLVDTEELVQRGYTIQMALLPQKDDVSSMHRDVACQAGEMTHTPAPATSEQAWLQARVNVELAGHPVQLTLHDSDESRLLARLEAVLRRVPSTATVVDDASHRERNQAAGLQHQEPMRYRIFELLRQHPTGLTRLEVQRALGTTKNLSDTLVGMVRHKHLIRVDTGKYALPPE